MKRLLLPHPVLMPGGNDYPNGLFDMTINDSKRTVDEKIVMTVKFELKSKSMRRMINDGKAVFVIVVKCARTYMREAIRIAGNETQLKLPLSEYADKIIITPYIASTKAVEKFRSKEHHEEFVGINLSLPAGAILARGSDSELTVDAIHTLSAAIRLVTDNRLDRGEYKIDLNDDYINIKMHNDTLNEVNRLRNSKMGILYPSIYMSAVTHAIHALDDNSHRKWAVALAKTLKESGMGTGDDLKEEPYRHAQKLLKNPLSRILVDAKNNG